MRGWPPVVVPGKVFLAGEYGVLAGGPALVMAVRRFARLSGTRERPPTTFEAEGLQRLQAAGVPLPLPLAAGLPEVDATDLRDAEGRKLGLGSSAAWSAAVTTSALAAAGERPGERPGVDPVRTWFLAHAVHGGGSGADVACCLAGGIVRFQRPDPLGSPEIAAVILSPAHLPIVVHGGQPVSTARALSGLESAEGKRLLREAAEAGETLCRALLQGETTEIRAAVDESARLLEALGRSAGLGSDTGKEVVEAVRKALLPFGGTAKPSGASGAELVLAYIPGVEPADRGRVKHALTEAGLQVMDLEVAITGASLNEEAEENSL